MITALEHILTNSYKADMVLYINTHHQEFDELIKLAISDKHPYNWRASWLLWSCMYKNDIRVKSYINKIIEILPLKKENQQRELLKVLFLMEIDEEYEGLLLNICIDIWEKTNKVPSIRFNAFKIIVKIIKKHKELLQELDFIMQSHYLESLSVGVKKSIYKMIKSLH